MSNINDLQEQFENLIKQGQELLEKMKENNIADASKKVERWKPKYGDHYYYIDSFGDVGEAYYDTNAYGDLFRYKTGNHFKTEEEAHKELDRRLAEQELLDMCDDSGVIEIGFDIDNREFCAMGEDSDYLFSPYRFATEESAKKAIYTLGEDKLKLIFRID